MSINVALSCWKSKFLKQRATYLYTSLYFSSIESRLPNWFIYCIIGPWSKFKNESFGLKNLTGCLRQVSNIIGLSFLWTTLSCMSSSVGWRPTSSSKGSLYSPIGPYKENKNDIGFLNLIINLKSLMVSRLFAVHALNTINCNL